MKYVARLLSLCFVLLLLLFVSCSQPDQQKETQTVEQHSRHIALEGQPNFRDLGGYKTADGRIVKWGQIFRSGELGELTDGEVSKLEELGIRTVVSFLLEAETEARGKDRLPPGTREVSLPIEAGGNMVAHASEARKTGDFSQVPKELNPEIHRMLVRDAKAKYATLLREIIDPDNRPLAFHCSHGVHRTGTASAILLSALGVPWETVREDYLLSNTYRAAEVEKRLAQLQQLAAQNQGIPPEEVDTTDMRAFYILEGFYIDGTLEEAVKEHGSMENFITEGLRISQEELQRLRNELLE